jgi:3'-phosphoadenosine 5'-phosphosulfate sulfotransferase (PAPS reductase)/FAD synthetase
MDTGDMYPSVLERVEKLKARVPSFIHLRSDAPEFRRHFGDPNDANWLDCCRANVYAPMHEYLRKNGYRQVLRGTKAVDPHIHLVFPGDVIDGVLYTMPLWHWTDAAVEQYLGMRLAEPYRRGAVGMPDCKTCTATAMCGGSTKVIWDEVEHGRQATLDLH